MATELQVWLSGFECSISGEGEYQRGQRELIAKLRSAFPGPGAKKGQAVQGELLPTPAPKLTKREPSQQERIFAEFQTRRREHLEITLGVTFTPDAHCPPAFINAAVGRMLERLADRENPEESLLLLFEDFFAETWPAKRPPPWSFRAFASDNVWPKLAGLEIQ